MDWYYKFLKWFKDKYGYDIWDKKFEGEEGKWSIGGILFNLAGRIPKKKEKFAINKKLSFY